MMSQGLNQTQEGSPVEQAQVRVATELRPDELQALKNTLERRFQCALELEVTLDPSILGGVWVRIGDIVIDGSLQGRLEALRHYLRAQSRVIVSSGFDLTAPPRTAYYE